MLVYYESTVKIYNAEIAKLFNRLADLLEIEGANPFRIRAYRNAARVISNQQRNIADLIAEGADLTQLPYIGADLAAKIITVCKTGHLPALQEIEQRVPTILSELMKVEGLGPKRVQQLYRSLHIQTLADLKQAIANKQLRMLKGFGAKLELKIKNSLQYLTQYQVRFKLVDAITIAESIVNYLQQAPGIKHIEIAGSYRRRQETVGDLDIIVIATSGPEVINYLTRYDEVSELLAKGSTRSTLRLRSGMQIDLRVMPAASYGAALLYFTGSKAHNINLRRMALKQQLKINEYGVYNKDKRIAGKTETDIYHTLGLPYIEPELREDRGEITTALSHKLPHLIKLSHIRGDLHCHTQLTDGTASLEAMATAAAEKGYQYIAITDHSKHLTVANGLNKERLVQQIKAIDKLNAKLANIRILKAIEVDILANGKLDLPDSVLKLLDLTVCAIHSQFGLSARKQTERIIRAMDNPYFNILAHPTGRLIGRREPYNIDMEKIMLAAKARNCFLELNAQPERLDLNDSYCKMAKELQVKIAISSDAHHINHFNYMQFGIYQARRGWLEPDDVLNTRDLPELLKLLTR